MTQVDIAILDREPEFHRVGLPSLSSRGRKVNQFLRCDILQFLARRSSHSLGPFHIRRY